MFIDHDHTHRWEVLGVGSGSEGWTVVYECADCAAWTSRTLAADTRVPFREGEVVDRTHDDADEGETETGAR